MQRQRIALQDDAAEPGEQLRIGLGDRAGVRHARRVRRHHRMAKHRSERWLQPARLFGAEHLELKTELPGIVALARRAGERLLAAIELEPAGLVQIARGLRLQHQRLVLGDGPRIERPHRLGEIECAFAPGVGAIGQQPWRKARQSREMIVGLRRLLQRDPQQRAKALRKGMREQRIAFDDAGIAVGGFLAGAATVDQCHRQPAFDEVQRRRNTDDACAQHDRVGTGHISLLPNFFRDAKCLARRGPLI